MGVIELAKNRKLIDIQEYLLRTAEDLFEHATFHTVQTEDHLVRV